MEFIQTHHSNIPMFQYSSLGEAPKFFRYLIKNIEPTGSELHPVRGSQSVRIPVFPQGLE